MFPRVLVDRLFLHQGENDFAECDTLNEPFSDIVRTFEFAQSKKHVVYTAVIQRRDAE